MTKCACAFEKEEEEFTEKSKGFPVRNKGHKAGEGSSRQSQCKQLFVSTILERLDSLHRNSVTLYIIA